MCLCDVESALYTMVTIVWMYVRMHVCGSLR